MLALLLWIQCYDSNIIIFTARYIHNKIFTVWLVIARASFGQIREMVVSVKSRTIYNVYSNETF